MPFGKYQGRDVDRLPKSYLKWLLRECDLSPELRRAVEDGLAGVRYDPPTPVDVDALVDQICEPWKEENDR